MSKEIKSMHVTAFGNLFNDLGIAPDNAAVLQAESDQLIASRFYLRRVLIRALTGWMGERRLSVSDGAAVLGTSTQRLSCILRSEGADISIDSLINLILRAGKRVEITVVD